jgi:hypothetical protein
MNGASPRPPAGSSSSAEDRLAGLVGALIGVVWILALPIAPPARPGAPAAHAQAAWPQAVRGQVSGRTPDGQPYTPVYFVDARTSVGTAPTADGGYLRLLLRGADGRVRETRRLPTAASPRFRGFAGADGWLAWAESVTDMDGKTTTTMWTQRPGTAEPARRLTADTGDVRFTDSEYDLVIARGGLHWASAAPGSRPRTEVRSIPLTGGPVRVEAKAGAWSPVAWPWLVSAGNAASGAPVRWLDLDHGETRAFVPAATELPVCGATWCRSMVLSGSGVAGTDLVRADGTRRRRVAGPDMATPLPDVALRDRFEVLTSFATPTGANGRPLLVYDLSTGATVTVADHATSVSSRGSILWWSTGSPGAVRWHTLDLASVP